MKKKTVKRMLVERMLSKGRGLRYSEMISELLKISRGEEYKYDWRTDRGYCATNFCKTSKGYMVTGVGDCGVYKGEDGKWYPKIYTTEEMVKYKINRIIKDLSRVTMRMSMHLQHDLERADTYTEQNIIRKETHSRLNNLTEYAQKSLISVYKWAQKRSDHELLGASGN